MPGKNVDKYVVVEENFTNTKSGKRNPQSLMCEKRMRPINSVRTEI